MSWLLLALALSAFAGRAVAQADVEACVADHKRVQTARESGHYLEGLEAAARCAQASCPQLIRQDCAAWHVDLADSTPSIVLDVRDERGRDLTDATVKLGDRALGARGRAVLLDPGRYELHVEAADHMSRVERIVVREGEKGRRVSISLQPALVAHQAAPPPPPRKLSPTVITLGAVGLAGLSTFAALAITGKLKRNELENCKPGCARAEVETVNQLYLGADIAAAVGGAAAIATVVVYALERKAERRVQVALQPFGASVRGAF